MTMRPERIFVYVDETSLTLPSGQRLLGAGALAVTQPVPQAIVDRAMDSLRTDPDRDPNSPRFKAELEKFDRRTLASGHFHASFDTMNGHSALAKEIRAGIPGNFMCSFSEPVTTKAEEAQFRTHAVNSILPALNVRAPVTFVFEQRSGFSNVSAQALVDHMNEGIDWCAYELTMIPAYYPSIDVAVRAKSEPGLQVVDMLLWSSAQAMFAPGTKKATIASWCGLRPWSDARVEGSSDRWMTAELNGGDPLLAVDEQEWLRSYPVRVDELEDGVDNAMLAEIYAFAERTVRAYVNAPLPPHAEHLREGMRAAIAGLADPQAVGVDQIRELARQYLRLLDTLPLYEGLARDDRRWLELIRAKRLVGLTLRSDLIHGVRTAMFFAQVRRDNVARTPTWFGI